MTEISGELGGRQRSPRRPPSLRRKILLGATALAVVIALAQAAVLYTSVVSLSRRAALETAEQTANMAFQLIETSADMALRGRLHDAAARALDTVVALHARAERGEIPAAQARDQALAELARRQVGNRGYIYVIDSSGTFVMHPHPDLTGRSLPGVAPVREQNARREGFLEYTWRNPDEDREYPKALSMLYFEPWDWIISATSYQDEFDSLIDVSILRERLLSLGWGQSGYTFLIGSDGSLIAHPRLRGNLVDWGGAEAVRMMAVAKERPSGSITYKWRSPDNGIVETRVAFYRRIPRLGWVVGASTGFGEAQAVIERVGLVMLLSTLAAVVAAAVVASLLSRGLARPLQALADRLESGAGSFAVRLPSESTDEVGRLARHFNAFMDSLEKARYDIAAADEDRSNALGRTSAILSAINEGFWEIDTLGRTASTNPHLCAIVGRPAETLRGVPSVGIVASPSRAAFVEALASAEAGIPVTIEAALDGAAGPVPCLLSLAPRRGSGAVLAGALVMVADISAQKRVEEELRRSRARYLHVFEAVTQGLAVMDGDGRWVEANAAALALAGCSLAEMGGPVPCSWLRPGSLEPIAVGDEYSDFLQAVRAGTPYTREVGATDSRGRFLELEVSGIALDPDGTSGRYLCVIRDVTDMRRAAHERARLAMAIDQIDEHVVITDTAGSIVYANKAFERVSGFAIADALGRNPRFMKSGRHDPEFYRELWETLGAGETWRGRIINRHKDGREYAEDATITPLRSSSDNVTSYVAVKRDVTKVLEEETRQRQRQKLEAVGQLAGGIAHDFNNILTAILGYAELALTLSPAGSSLCEAVGGIVGAGTRARDLVSKILTFSRKSQRELRPFALESVVKDAIKLLRASYPAAVEFEGVISSPGMVMADVVEMHQLIMNLGTNAVQAIGESAGVVRVTLAEEPAADGGPPRVVLSVSDTGCGMSPQTMAHLFEPFFTTRQGRGGTGLGMSVVHGIVTAMRGEIGVESEPGKGTTVTLNMPGHWAAVDAGGEAPVVLLGRGEHLLLVDDEKAVLEVGRRLLSEIGYVVTTAGGGADAVRILGQAPARFDLVLTDLAMPGMSGIELARSVASTSPGIPVVLLSGRIESTTLEAAGEAGIRKLVAKPFLKHEIARALREVLGV
jgi:PAS domain S-box-containing protein